MKNISAFLIVVETLLTPFALAATPTPNTASVTKLECVGTAEEPGRPRNFFLLEKQPDGTFSAKFAENSKAGSIGKATLVDLATGFTCEFATNDNRLFYCAAQGGSIYGVKNTRTQIPVPGFAPRNLISYQVTILGQVFSAKINGGVAILDFLFADNCVAQ